MRKSCSDWFSSSFSPTEVMPRSNSMDVSAKKQHGKKSRTPRNTKKSVKRSHAFCSFAVLPENEDPDDDIIFLEEVKPNISEEISSENGSLISAPSSSPTTVPLVDRFPPTTAEHLAVHSKKVEQVRQWLVQHCGGDRRSKALLLTGPCGSGKTATVKVLCKELNLELVEWESPDHYDVGFDETGEEIIREQSQSQTFADFLKTVDLGSLETAHQQKVVLIEQLPNTFYREPAQLHSVLRSLVMQSTCIFIFVLSAVESCWYLSPRRIFPTNTLCALGFDTICFNPCAVTFLQKALKRITSALKITAIPSQLKRIADASNGDVRSAINNLELCIGANGKLNEDIELYSSSSQTDPFHCIGKMLYAKRREEDDPRWSASENLLSSELKMSHSRPRPPKDNLSQIIDRSGLTGENLALFLHEHELYFSKSISDIRYVFDNISCFDAAVGYWETRSDPALSGYEAEIASRSTIFYNYGFKYNSKKGLHNFYKPRWRPVQLAVESIVREGRAAYPVVPPKDLFTLILPMTSLIMPPLDVMQKRVFALLQSGGNADDRFEMNRTVQLASHFLQQEIRTLEEEDNFEIEEVGDDEW